MTVTADWYCYKRCNFMEKSKIKFILMTFKLLEVILDYFFYFLLNFHSLGSFNVHVAHFTWDLTKN